MPFGTWIVASEQRRCFNNSDNDNDSDNNNDSDNDSDNYTDSDNDN